MKVPIQTIIEKCPYCSFETEQQIDEINHNYETLTITYFCRKCNRELDMGDFFNDDYIPQKYIEERKEQ